MFFQVNKEGSSARLQSLSRMVRCEVLQSRSSECLCHSCRGHPVFPAGKGAPIHRNLRKMHTCMHMWVPRCIFSSAASPSEQDMRWLTGFWSRLVSLPQSQAVNQCWAGSSTLSLLALRWGHSSCRSCSMQFWKYLLLQTLVTPQRNLRRFSREDVTVQDPRTVKGFNPNNWRSQPVGSWQEGHWCKALTGSLMLRDLPNSPHVMSALVRNYIKIQKVCYAIRCLGSQGRPCKSSLEAFVCKKPPNWKKKKSFFQLQPKLCVKLNLPSPGLIPVAPPGFSMYPTMKVKSNPIQLEENEWLIYNKWPLNNNKPTREQWTGDRVQSSWMLIDN